MTVRSKVPHQVAPALMSEMEANWTNHGGLGEPFSIGAAVEIALNELLDYAKEKGFRVRLARNMQTDEDITDLIVG